jgi:hypothetical protein
MKYTNLIVIRYIEKNRRPNSVQRSFIQIQSYDSEINYIIINETQDIEYWNK